MTIVKCKHSASEWSSKILWNGRKSSLCVEVHFLWKLGQVFTPEKKGRVLGPSFCFSVPITWGYCALKHRHLKTRKGLWPGPTLLLYKKKTPVHLIISPLNSSSSSSSSFCSWVVKDGFLTVDQGIGTARGASPGAKLVCKLITSVFLVNFVMWPLGRWSTETFSQIWLQAKDIAANVDAKC
jgi:hypothetical protein